MKTETNHHRLCNPKRHAQRDVAHGYETLCDGNRKTPLAMTPCGPLLSEKAIAKREEFTAKFGAPR